MPEPLSTPAAPAQTSTATSGAPVAPGAHSAAAPEATHREAGAFVSLRARRRYIGLIVTLLILAGLVTYGLLAHENPAEPGSRGWWLIAQMRATSVGVIAVVAVCHAFATVSFHTVTGNRILTPSIMGFESLYTAIQTAAVFFLGAVGVTAVQGTWQFLGQAALMVVLATILYTWLLRGRTGGMHVMLLVGVVIGGGLASLSSFMQRLLDPNEFDVLTARMFGNISNASGEYLPVAVPIVLVCAVVLWLRARRMNVLALGADVANNLGIRHRREVIITLALVSVLMAMTTSLVGPMTFLGFLVATLAYSLTDTYDHRVILPAAALLGYVVLGGAYFILRNVFYAGGAVTVIIELVGGTAFLIVILRKGRL